MTQTWLPDEVAGKDRLTYEPVFCMACSKNHFICVETGRALGDRVEAVTATHGPAFPPEPTERATVPRAADAFSASAMQWGRHAEAS